jgi:hypothetical protein
METTACCTSLNCAVHAFVFACIGLPHLGAAGAGSDKGD